MERVEVTPSGWRLGRFEEKASELVWMEEKGPSGKGEWCVTFAEKPRQGRAGASQACNADRCLGKGL